MCAFKVFVNTLVFQNTLNISHGHKLNGSLEDEHQRSLPNYLSSLK